MAVLERRLSERDGHLSAALEQLAQLKGQLAKREVALAKAGARARALRPAFAFCMGGGRRLPLEERVRLRMHRRVRAHILVGTRG